MRFLSLALVCQTLSALKFLQLKQYTDDSYVTVYWPDGQVRGDSVSYTHASTFEVHCVSESCPQWQLRAVKNNLYLSAENGGGSICVANRTSASGWETFDVTYLANDRVQLRSFSGKWLRIEPISKQLLADSVSAGDSETFIVEYVSQHRGVNLGSWFVPEKWMFSSSSPLWVNTSAVDLYTLSVELGSEEASRRMNNHWSTWFTEQNFIVMKENGINHVRVPIGYWDVEEAWPYVFGGDKYIDLAIQWAQKYDMSVLIDLHGCPGSQNGQDHSGHAGAIDWPSDENVAKTVNILTQIAKRWANVANVWGIEVMNEPHYSLSHDLLASFYQQAYAAIRQSSASVHVVINSLYGPHDWTAGVLPEPQYRNVILDLHLYTVWSGYTSPEQFYQAGKDFGTEIRSLTPYYPVIVGEMSLATSLNPYTSEQRQVFGDSEMTSFHDNAFGYMFWSDKLEYTSSDWCLVDGFSYVAPYYLTSE